MEALTQAQHKAAEAMYRSAGASGRSRRAGRRGQPAARASGQPRSDGRKGDVIDAEVVEEEKK